MKCSVASSVVLESGWYFLASDMYDFLMSSTVHWSRVKPSSWKYSFTRAEDEEAFLQPFPECKLRLKGLP